MNKKEFWRAYRTSQDKVIMSEEFKQAIYESTLREDMRKTARTPNARQRSKECKPQGKIFRLRYAAAAACLVLAIALVGIPSLLSNGGASSTPGITNFTVQAYALDTNTAIEPSDDKLIVFSRTASLNGMPQKADYLAPNGGYYTGSLFGVQGDNITRLQASISTGLIYKYEAEVISRDDNVERWRELVSWKDSTRGLGEYFNMYDSVEAMGYAVSSSTDNAAPDKTTATAVMSKKLGSTIDIPINEDTKNYRFGFWTNDDYGDTDGLQACDAVLNLFDGAKLTVTVTFADGTTSTQVIELKVGDVRSSAKQLDNGAWVIDIDPEIIDAESAGLVPHQEYERVLYGKLLDSNSGAFPGSLDNANELANIVDEGYKFEPRALIVPREPVNGKPVTLDDLTLKAAGESFEIGVTGHFNINDTANYDERLVPLTMSNLTATKSKTLPAGISLDSMETSLGSWEYFNKVTGEMDGYTVGADGTVSEGYSWLLMEATLTNDTDQHYETSCQNFRDLCIVDADGQVLKVNVREISLKNDSSPGASVAVYMDLAFVAYESQTVRWLIVVPDEVMAAPTVFFSNTESCIVEIN